LQFQNLPNPAKYLQRKAEYGLSDEGRRNMGTLS